MQIKRPKDISKAFRLLKVSKSSLQDQSVKNDRIVEQNLVKLTAAFAVEGFWKCNYRIWNNGEVITHKRLHPIFKQMGRPLRNKAKKRLPVRVKGAIGTDRQLYAHLEH